VRNILIDKPGGGHVRLGDVAAVRAARTPIAIEREGVSRKLDIVADVSGRSVSAVASDLERRLANVPLPLEYHARVLTDTVADEIDAGKVIGFAIAAAVLILLLLQAAVRSWRLAITAFLALPIAAAGGVVGALVAGGELALGVAAGLLGLVVLATRSGLTLIRRMQDLEREGDAFGADLVRRGAGQRLAPTVTSAMAIGVLLLPFVVMGSRAGLEVIHPMAVVVLCGLVTWVALTLFVLPTLYLRLATADDRGAVTKDEADDLPVFAGEGTDDSTAVVR
jgi:Cu/Ag efflux pump CusA